MQSLMDAIEARVLQIHARREMQAFKLCKGF